MMAVTLPVELFTAQTTGEVGKGILTHFFLQASAVQKAWITLHDESLSRTRTIALWQNEGEYCQSESEATLELPQEVARLSTFAMHEPQTIQFPSTGETLTFLPFVVHHVPLGMLLIRWKEAVDTPLLRQLMDVLPAFSLLLYAQNREGTFRDLERSKQQWEAAFDSLRDPLFIYDTEGRLQKVNLALAKRLGVSPREIITQPALFQKHFGEVLTLSPKTPQWSSRTLDATFEVQCADVYDHEQRLSGWIYILRDVSDRVRLESQMRQSEKLAALGEMVSGIAHELNNPLTSIVGFAEMLVLSDLPIPDAVRNRIRKIGMEADRAALIVQNMLAFVRPPASNQAPLSLNEVVQQVADLRTDMLESHQICLDLDMEPNLPLVKGCVHELQQVLLNLIDNAIHALKGCRNQGNIVITTRSREEKSLTLTVTDNGVGILPEHKEKLLLPFFTTKRVGEGSGLGLSISYGILRSHGATLDIHSEVGKGASFIIDRTSVV